MKRLTIVRSLAVGLLVFCLPASALANPLDELGFGAKAIALGGAATTFADDFSATYYNPAGLASSDALRLELGYAYNRPSLRLNDEDLGVDLTRGLQGGLVIPGRIFERRIAFGLGLFLPDERISRIRALPQGQPRFVLYDNRPQRLVISIAAGFEILEGLYVGAGMTFLSNTEGVLDIKGIVSASDVERTTLFSAVDVRLTAVRYVNAGILYQLGDNWRFGLSFRDEFSLELDLDVRVSGDVTLSAEDLVLVEDGLFALKALNHNLFSPRQLILGVGYRGDGWSVSFDLGWLQWSRFPPPTSTIEIELDLGALEFELPESDKPVDPNFSDIFVPRVGGEYQVFDSPYVDLVVRAGYFYQPSPAPAQSGLTNYVDSDRHGLCGGLGASFKVFESVLPRPIEIDLAGLFIVLEQRTYDKSDAADPVGDYVASGNYVGAAVTTRLKF